MIETFKHKGLRRLYEKNDRSGIRSDLVEKAQKILSALDAANGPEDMALPLLRFHLVDWRPARYLLGNGQGQLAHYIPLSRRGRA